MKTFLSWLAERTMAKRPPDFVIGVKYLSRWFVIPRNPIFNIYIHRYIGSDEDRAMHDHPWPSLSLLVRGKLKEHRLIDRWYEATPRYLRGGDWVFRGPWYAHRLELISDEAVTVFITGPKIRTWGFWCMEDEDDARFVPWHEFVDPKNPGMPGRGCN